MSLVVHHGPHLGPLGDALAAALTDPLDDPFVAEVVAVPTAGVRDWLQRRLAMTLGATGSADGVTANVDFVFPGRFVARALGARDDDIDPWEVERLTWTVLAVLESGAAEVPGPRRAPYATARRVADLLDRYAVNRPQIIQQWSLGHDGDGTVDANDAVVPLPDDQQWQPTLWRAVRGAIGVPSRAERLPELLADLRAGRLRPDLPERVALFGVSTMSPGQLQVVDALAEVVDVTIHLVHPSTVAWSTSPHRLAGALTPRTAVDAVAAVRHPLLRSWGRPAMEAAALLAGSRARDVAHATSPGGPAPVPSGQLRLDLDGASSAPPPTLLGRVQADLFDDRPAAAETSVRNDDSMQFHACHGATRQLEVVRDALGHLFAADPSLEPQDVLLLCPDLDRFAPIASAVFGRGSFPIPVRVTDLSLGSQNAVGTALQAVLDVIAGRADAAQVLALCGLDPIRVRFGIDDDDIERYDRWTTDLRTTWGLDVTHRTDWLSIDVAEGTWAAMLDRLLLGAAMPAPAPRIVFVDLVPYDDISADGFDSAGRLADLLARLRTAREAAAGAKAIDEWCEVLVGITQSLFATRVADEWQLSQVVDEIDRVRENSTVGTGRSAAPLTLSDVRTMLDGLLESPHGRLDLRSGSVVVTTLTPVRNLPSRVVCIVGVEEGTLRASGVDGDDVLAVRPCIGERDARAEGRHLLLDALLAAEDHLIVTFDGNDLTTNRRLPLPVHLGELLEVVACTAGSTVEELVTRHPRRAHDERNFAPSNGRDSFSFDSCMLEGAEARRRLRHDAVIVPDALEPLAIGAVTIAELTESCTRPARTYLRDRLDVRLPRTRENLDPNIPLAVTPLEVYSLGDDLLGYHRVAHDRAAADWRATTRLQGGLPPRELATAALSAVEEEVDDILDALPELRELFVMATASATVEIGLAAPTWMDDRKPVVLRDTVGAMSGDTLVRVEFTRPKARTRMAVALALAALIVDRPDAPWNAVVAMRAQNANSKPVVVRLLPRVPTRGADAAMTFLETALDVRLRALREPLPLFEVSRDLFETGSIEDRDLERDMWDDANAFLWGDRSVDDLLSIPPVHSDPISDAVPAGGALPSRMVGFATLVWQAYKDFVDEADVQ